MEHYKSYIHSYSHEEPTLYRQKHDQDLLTFIDKLKTYENFTIVKFGDGEWQNMVSTDENNRNGECNYLLPLGLDLIKAYAYFLGNEKSFICKWPAHTWQISTELEKDFGKNLENKFVYWEFLIHRLPFPKNVVNFFKTVKNNQRRKIYISNNRMMNIVGKILNVNIGIVIPSNNCYYKKQEILNTVLEHLTENCIVIVSAGMTAKVLIHELSVLRPNNTFIDAGSTFDGIVYPSREYHYHENYAQLLYNEYA